MLPFSEKKKKRENSVYGETLKLFNLSFVCILKSDFLILPSDLAT